MEKISLIQPQGRPSTPKQVKKGYECETITLQGDRVTIEEKENHRIKAPFSEKMLSQCFTPEVKHLSNAHTIERMNALLKKKKEGVREEVVINNDEHIHTIYHGVPDYVKPFNHKGVVFRHYFANEEQKKSALSTEALIAGPVAYAQVYFGGIRNDFPDLTGVFFTLPGVDPSEVGVPGRTVYVDVELPDDTGLVEIEPGKIYMVPGDPKRPDWIVDYYNKYKNGEKVPDYVLSTLKRIEAQGGIKEPTKVFFKAK